MISADIMGTITLRIYGRIWPEEDSMGLSGMLSEALGLDRMRDLVVGETANEDKEEKEKEDVEGLKRKLKRAERRIADLEDEVSELTEKLRNARRRNTGSRKTGGVKKTGMRSKKVKVRKQG